MKRDYNDYLADILEAINRIEAYLKKKEFDDFSMDQMAIDAVVRNFEVISDATKHIPRSFGSRHPDVPWRAMIGMKDKLVQESYAVNPEVLWKTAKGDLPGLKAKINGALGVPTGIAYYLTEESEPEEEEDTVVPEKTEEQPLVNYDEIYEEMVRRLKRDGYI
jgi:uncharacterized protein with HEPN domain